MPSVLRSRLALFAILGVFLIPIVTTNLRGLTHILTCDDSAEVGIFLSQDAEGSATSVSREESEAGTDSDPAPATDSDAIAPHILCDGLAMTIEPSEVANRQADLLVRIQNLTEDKWHGSVSLQIGSITVPVGIGRIDPGQIADDTVTINIAAGETRYIKGDLLIGP